MPVKPCDEIAGDIIDAQKVAERKTGKLCKLNLQTVLTMVEEVSSRYEPEFELEPILDEVLRLNFIDADDEPSRTGYKCALGKIFNRRMRYAQEKQRAVEQHLAESPFAPS